MYKYNPTWALCPKAFEDVSTSHQVISNYHFNYHNMNKPVVSKIVNAIITFLSTLAAIWLNS